VIDRSHGDAETHAALQDGSIRVADIDAALRRKFRVAIKLGLLDPPDMVPYTKISGGPEAWNDEQDRAVSRQMALESVVLLKNQNNTLALDKNKIKSIAVIGHWTSRNMPSQLSAKASSSCSAIRRQIFLSAPRFMWNEDKTSMSDVFRRSRLS
jgi:beta-glucosidase-like glycosyl hydrolase